MLIGLLAFSQYLRPLSFLECKFSNLFKAETVKCDCEKKAGYEKPVTGETQAPKTHTHLHLDEYFSPNKVIHISPWFSSVSSAYKDFYPAGEAKGCATTPWQPPNL